jgi:type I restriction enzyme S subunit
MSSIMREDWIEVELGEVCFTTSGGTPSRRNAAFYQGSIPWVKSGELDKGIIYDTEEHISEEAVKKSSAKIFPEGTLLIALYGATIGKLAFLGVAASTNQAICGIYKSGAFESKYLFNFLLNRKQKLISQGTGGAQPNISQTILKKLEIPLAPLPIQRAIVSKIEALFSDLDNGIANFKKAQEQLKIYRQAVLKKAFEGKLSELGKVGLKDDRIIDVEKDEKTEILKSNNPKNPNSDNKRDNLPKGWKWVKLKDISEFITDGDHQAPPKADEGIPFITISNVNKNTNKINFDNTFKVKSEYYFGIKDHRKPKIGDILYTVTGSFGIPIIIDFEKEFCFQRHIGLVRPLSSVNQKYLYYLLQTNAVFNQASETATGTAQKTVALSSLRNFTIPFCSSTQEQTQIVQEIESRLSVCDKMEQSINESIEKAEALRQSILKKAFEGKLLSQAEIAQCKQAADYEPASELLKKIQAEKLAILQQAQDAKKKKPSVKKK